MKNLLAFFLILGIAFSSCKKDDNESIQLLHWDGNNQNAPELPVGDYIVAARFPAIDLTEYVDSSLTGVRFYLQSIPNDLRVVVYEGETEIPGNSVAEPTNVVFQSNVLSATVESGSWNTVDIPAPVVITGEPLWIAVSFRHNENIRSIGCDPGPALTNGDLIQDAAVNDGKWTKFSTETPESINWNIRGIIGEN